MSTPDATPRITLEPTSTRWRAKYAGHVIADTDDALILRERGIGPVVYFPRSSVAMEYTSRTNLRTHCPYKGDASYFSLMMDGQLAENAIWTYENPVEKVDAIEERLAFDAKFVEVYSVDDAVVGAKPHLARSAVDEIVQHTDAGDGHAQREHWPANVSSPDDATR